jgi:hypothetical protein
MRESESRSTPSSSDQSQNHESFSSDLTNVAEASTPISVVSLRDDPSMVHGASVRASSSALPIRYMTEEVSSRDRAFHVYSLARVQGINVPNSGASHSLRTALASTNTTLDSGLTLGVMPMIGIDYDLSDDWSLTLHAGQSRFVRMQTYQYGSGVAEYRYLGERVTEVAVTSAVAPWITTGVGYRWGTDDAFELESYLTAGLELTKMSPMGALDAIGSYRLAGALRLRAGAFLESAVTKPLAMRIVGIDPTTKTLGEKRVGRDLQNVLSTSGGFSIGIELRP